ncbi:hypothetical protein CALCODRAFT_509171 [Calocera cornea HHB12733]|uniref:SWI5-dependent HO expression protein 3 n=1 Tax=Calocera cornea HHB12733 TaxID=1353952 RepID=A0A165FJD0_9BASI|nr:hypothetical protein CALCODRAFT_509171 [Calocera cornea HHB12733]
MATSASAIPVPVPTPSRPSSRQASLSRPSSRLSLSQSQGPASPTKPLRSPDGPPSAYPNGRSTRRQSSFDQLSVIAAAIGEGESHLPLPVAGSVNGANGALGPPVTIREGLPENFRSPSPLQKQRSGSPTRSISRIPVSSVGHARFLAEDTSLSASTSQQRPASSLSALPSPSLGDPLTPTSLSGEPLSPSPSSPGFGSAFKQARRPSGSGSGNTTKVLAELQAGVSNARNALENTKNQLRTSQRLVAQLTRQNEDLKDGRERMRMENENLNHARRPISPVPARLDADPTLSQVVARKERLLQELLDRARKAEAEAAALKSQLKTDTAASKSQLKEMEKQLLEASTVSQKSHREYITLSESLRGMTGVWKADMDAVRREMHRREETHRREVEEMRAKYESVLGLVQGSKSERTQLDALKQEAHAVDRDLESFLAPQLDQLLKSTSQSESDSAAALRIAQSIQDELNRIRRLMRVGHGPTPSVSGFSASIHPSPATPNLSSISE